jgi:hypothetical protein
MAWNSGEMSPNPGGLIRWPVRLLMPIGFTLLILQAVSELIKRFAFLGGHIANPLVQNKGPSAEEELAEAIKKHQIGPEVVNYVEAFHDMVDDKNGKKGESK